MGHSVINPVCSIAETVNRGSLASDMRIENRLGAAIAVLYRNGVNAIIPPKLKGVSVNGTIEISIAYRCTDGTLLNQYGNLIAKHPEVISMPPAKVEVAPPVTTKPFVVIFPVLVTLPLKNTPP